MIAEGSSTRETLRATRRSTGHLCAVAAHRCGGNRLRWPAAPIAAGAGLGGLCRQRLRAGRNSGPAGPPPSTRGPAALAHRLPAAICSPRNGLAQPRPQPARMPVGGGAGAGLGWTGAVVPFRRFRLPLSRPYVPVWRPTDAGRVRRGAGVSRSRSCDGARVRPGAWITNRWRRPSGVEQRQTAIRPDHAAAASTGPHHSGQAPAAGRGASPAIRRG